MATKKELIKFLKEKSLTREFNRFQKIRHKRKTRLQVSFSNHDGTSRRTTLILTKENGKTVVRDLNGIVVLGRFKGSINKVRDGILTKETLTKDIKSSKGWDIKSRIKTAVINLKNKNSYISVNKAINRHTEVVLTNKPPRKKFGFLIVDATFKGANGENKRVQARAPGPSPLWRASERRARLDEALIIASGIAGFSPTEIIIHEIYFEYRKTIKSRAFL